MFEISLFKDKIETNIYSRNSGQAVSPRSHGGNDGSLQPLLVVDREALNRVFSEYVAVTLTLS